MILAIDAGNSTIRFGFFRSNVCDSELVISTALALRAPNLHYEIIEAFEKARKPIPASEVACLSSVVPQLTAALKAAIEVTFSCSCLVFNEVFYSRLGLSVPVPQIIGSDLVANAYGLCSLYGRNGIIVDAGTALSFTAVTKNRNILGVALTPGLGMASHSLHSATAQLPLIDLQYVASSLGRDSEESIRAGLFFGYRGLTLSLIEVMKAEALEKGDFENPLVLLVGGQAALLKQMLESAHAPIGEVLVEEGFTLRALAGLAGELVSP